MISLHHFCEDLKVFSSKNLIQSPLISVILPTYCRGDNGLLKRALDSVLSQTFQNFELIIVDDGSVDGTEKLVKSYMEQYQNIIYMRNYTNSGLPALRVNQGIEHARGEFICFQFDDDEWLENALETLYNFYISKNELCVVYGKVVLKIDNQELTLGKDFNQSDLKVNNFIANNSVLVPIEIFEKYGLYDMHLIARRLCDWDLWIRFSEYVHFYFCDKTVSIVYAAQDNSVGMLFPLDYFTYKIYSTYPDRYSKIKVTNYKNQEVTNLSLIHKIYLKQHNHNKFMLPFFIKHRKFKEVIPYQSDSKKFGFANILVNLSDVTSSIDIMIGNFTKLLEKECSLIPIHEEMFNFIDLNYFDYIFIARSVSYSSKELILRAKGKVPIIYFIDDDLLNIYKISPAFSYLEPGTEMYENLKFLIKNSDLVITYSDSITKSIQPLNNKVIRLTTNILSKYLSNSLVVSEKELIDIAFIGGNARKEEIEFLWDILLKFAKEYSNKIRFHFWGYIPEKVDELASIIEVKTEPFTNAYYAYLNKLQKANFDIILSPLFNDEFRKGKSPIKLLEACVANALGVFSNSPIYDEIEHGMTGIKVPMEADAWYEALESIVAMSHDERKAIIQNAKQFVLANYSTESQLEDFKAIFEQSTFNIKLQNKYIAYTCHSGYLNSEKENHLFKHAKIMKDYGYNIVFLIPDSFKEKNEKLEDMCKIFDIPVVFCPLNFIVTETDNFVDTTRQEDINYFAHCIKDFDIGLFHSSTIMPLVGAYAKKVQIPYIASVYAVSSTTKLNLEIMPKFLHTDSVRYATRWGELLSDAYVKCIRTPLEDQYFEYSHKKESSKTIRFAIVGILQERKGQLELIKALGELKQKGIDDIHLSIYGYDHFFEEYKKSCFDAIDKYGLSEQVKFCGLVDDLWFSESIDCLVCASDYESFPQVILEAMALKIPVVTTLAGGIGELIIDNYSGYVASGFDSITLEKALQRFIIDYKENKEKLHSIIENASKIVDIECRVKNVGLSLIKLYNLALENNTSKFISMGITDRAEIQILSQKLLPVADLSTLKVVWLHKKYSFDLDLYEAKEISKIYFIPATNFKKFDIGVLQCTLSNKNYPSLKLREVQIPLSTIIDNGWLLCEFETIFLEASAQLQIEFQILGSAEKIAVYTNKNSSLHAIVE